jgi:hypothetical protein
MKPYKPDLHRPTIEPGKAPGGVYVRICSLDQLLTEYPLVPPVVAGAVESAADVDAGLILDHEGERIWTYFYDGDTGACMRTIITDL